MDDNLGNDDYHVSVWASFAQKATNVLLDGALHILNANCEDKTTICDNVDARKVGSHVHPGNLYTFVTVQLTNKTMKR